MEPRNLGTCRWIKGTSEMAESRKERGKAQYTNDIVNNGEY